MELENNEAKSRGVWNSAWKTVKCVAGTITKLVIGTVIGTALGGWCGALVGVATFC